MSDITTAVRSLFRALATAAAAPIFERLQTMSDQFSSEIAKLQADVAAQSTVIASATAAFQGLAKQLADAEAAAKGAGATDEQIAAVTAVRTGLESNTASLAAAIPQNTPAADTSAATAQPAQPAASAPAPTPTPTETPDGNAAAGSVVDPA